MSSKRLKANTAPTWVYTKFSVYMLLLLGWCFKELVAVGESVSDFFFFCLFLGLFSSYSVVLPRLNMRAFALVLLYAVLSYLAIIFWKSILF